MSTSEMEFQQEMEGYNPIPAQDLTEAVKTCYGLAPDVYDPRQFERHNISMLLRI